PILRETMGEVSQTTSLTSHVFNQGVDSKLLLFTEGIASNSVDIRNSSPSSGYINPLGEEASGGANVWFSGTGQRGFAIHNLHAKAFDSLCLYFAYRKENTSSNADFTLAWSIDDTHWDTLISP